MEDFTQENLSYVDLGVDLDTVPEQHAVKAGEHPLQLLKAEIKTQKPEKGTGKFIQATIEVTDDPNSKLITHVMMMPTADDNQRKINARLRAIGDFYKAFGIPSAGPVNLEEYVGNQAWGNLTEEEDPQYGMQNRIKNFVLGK
jgi:hypothetical protein